MMLKKKGQGVCNMSFYLLYFCAFFCPQKILQCLMACRHKDKFNYPKKCLHLK